MDLDFTQIMNEMFHTTQMMEEPMLRSVEDGVWVMLEIVLTIIHFCLMRI